QINKTSESKSVANIGIYKASDDQSQSALARNIIALKHKDDFEQTVIVAPTEQILQTVIAEVSALGCDFNVSAGYPAGKTALFVLIRDIINARISMQNGKYFVKDLLRVLTNPLIKNMRFFTDSSAARIAVHKIEEAFSPGCAGVSALSGRSFVKLEEISKDAFVNEEIIKLAGYKLSAEKLRAVFEEMFKFLFLDWQNIVSFNALAVRIEEFVLQIFKYSIIRTYPLNVAAAQTLNDISKDLKAASAAAAGNQKFDTLDIFKIFNDLISGKKIALKGSPLKGLQVLGFLEARNLSFKNVFILGMSDSALPSVSKTSPLIPLEIMRFLGIKMPSREYEIQQYHFERLIAQAQNVYLVYPGNDEEPRSRFIEKIIWDKQLSCKNINAAPISEFNVASQKFVFDQRKKYEKTPDIKKFLKEKTHSYSAIDKYLQCELKFYFHYVCGLDDEETEISKDAGAREIGVFVHDFLKEAFCAGLKYSLINSEAFKLKFDALFEDIFKKSVFVNRQDSYFVKKVLQYRLEKFLYEERQRDFGVVCECEKEFRAKISCADKTEFNLTAKIDRIDEKDGSYTIIDYKTSSQDCVIKPRIFDLSRKDFDRKYLQSAVSSLQLPMYEYVFGQQTGFPVGSCFLYDLKRAAPVYFYEENKHKKNGSQQEYLSRCIQMLSWALDDICAGTHFKFNPCDDTKQCQTCKFRHICS
ncbi:MAG: PD-(D/E)XK nuclease family protein, partial [Endomicrobium sp.]|nr:PD-(D/E)XK nuclease family protein [Endomicrobium sp.]